VTTQLQLIIIIIIIIPVIKMHLLHPFTSIETKDVPPFL
jgi:hypothetical protein